MEIRVLQYFLTVVREESINRAAEVLHITQPTLSRQLSQLEEEVGVRLFHRGARKIKMCIRDSGNCDRRPDHDAQDFRLDDAGGGADRSGLPDYGFLYRETFPALF